MRVSPLFFAFVSLACAAPPPSRSPAPVATLHPEPAPQIWKRFAELGALPLAGEPFKNDGHPGAGERATVRVSADALPGYQRLVTDSVMPDAALVAIFHDGAAGGAAGPIYVMSKAGSGWEYFALTSTGALQPPVHGRSATAGCPGCHQGAVADSLFGLPHPTP